MERKELVALKAKLKRRAKALDMNLFGVADVERWASRPIYDGKSGKLTMKKEPITPSGDVSEKKSRKSSVPEISVISLRL